MQSVSAPLSGPIARPPAITLRLASDARLARLAAAGSEGAMAAIFERHHQALQRYCYSIVGNSHDAADALQNTMIKTLRALPGETRQLALRPWLYRIAHNESISLLRARRPEGDLDAVAHLSDAAASGAVETRERLHSLTEDLGELTERQRGALLMRELGGLEFTEVAEAMGTSAAAAKQSVYEARCALQALQAGRAMECDAVQRTLSDGDRRMLRSMRMRGHLRACAACRDFEAATHQRPAQLTAMIPPLPVAAAAAMLHGILGGGGTGGGGGGLAAGFAGTAKATAGGSVAAKAGAVVAVSATLVAGGVYVAPEIGAASPDRPTLSNASVIGAEVRDRAPNAASGAAYLEISGGGAAVSAPGGAARIQEGTKAGGGPAGLAESAKHSTASPSGSGTSAVTTAGRPPGSGESVGAAAGLSSSSGTTAGATAGPPSASAGTNGRKPPKTNKDATKGGGKPPKAGESSGTSGGGPSGTPVVTPGGQPAGTPGPPAAAPLAPGGTPGASGCSGRSGRKPGHSQKKPKKKDSAGKRHGHDDEADEDDKECDDD